MSDTFDLTELLSLHSHLMQQSNVPKEVRALLVEPAKLMQQAADELAALREQLKESDAKGKGVTEQEPVAWRWKDKFEDLQGTARWNYSNDPPTYNVDASKIEPLYAFPWDYAEKLRAARQEALEAWTFIDAVSAMGFPPDYAHVAEEAERIRRNRALKPGG